MDFLELAQARYSVRSYHDKPVPEKVLARILESVRLAPSGANRQPWRFVVVQDAQIRNRLVEACNGQQFVGQAPVVIAGCGLMPERIMHCGMPGDAIDLAIAMEHLALAAAAEGLGTCWIGAFGQDKVRDVLGIPDTARVVEVMTLGYPADTGGPKKRKSLEDIVCYDGWS